MDEYYRNNISRYRLCSEINTMNEHGLLYIYIYGRIKSPVSGQAYFVWISISWTNANVYKY